MSARSAHCGQSIMRTGNSSLKRLLSRVNKVARLRPRGFASYEPMTVTRAEFDKQYANGEWKRLEHISELAHYSMIAGYSSFFHESPAILDVGCGHGVLQRKLAGKYAHYTGVDSSSETIGQAESHSDERTRFLVADATAYVPDRSFDQMVFNEILYYMAKPGDLIAHYLPYLDRKSVV